MRHKDYDEFAVTIDIDWAPDIAIDKTAKTLIDNNVKCTWYITHTSPAITRLIENKELFECGIHPNFLANSSHGETVDEVLKYISSIVPDAKSVRSHALVSSSHILAKLRDHFDIETDTTLFLQETPDLKPHLRRFREGGKDLLRFPYFWEDDTETINPEKSWSLKSAKYQQKGLKIMNFHPMYIYLNCDTMAGYEDLKKIKLLPTLTKEDMESYINQGAGAGTFFEELVGYIDKSQKGSHTIEELSRDWYSYQEKV